MTNTFNKEKRMNSLYFAQFGQDWHCYKIYRGKAISLFRGDSFLDCVKFSNANRFILLRQQRPPKKIHHVEHSVNVWD